MTNDYSAFKRAAPTSEQLSALSALVRQMHDAETELAMAEEVAKQKAENLRQIAETQLPELMASVGMQEFTTTDGLKVKIERAYTAAPTVANRDQAYDWLEANGHGGLVKRSIEVGFGVEQQADAAQLAVELEGRFNNVNKGRKVEPSSMRAWAKRMIEDGVPFPKDLFGARVFDRAKIKAT